MSAWKILSEDTYDSVWERFYAQFKFQPNYYERTIPAICEPEPSVVFDLAGYWDEASLDCLNDQLQLSFQQIVRPDEFLYVLDWQHTCYQFMPHLGKEAWPISIFPDGDYYIFLASDFSFGTFGHPWQQSLCVFGSELLATLSEDFKQKFPTIRSR